MYIFWERMGCWLKFNVTLLAVNVGVGWGGGGPRPSQAIKKLRKYQPNYDLLINRSVSISYNFRYVVSKYPNQGILFAPVVISLTYVTSILLTVVSQGISSTFCLQEIRL